MLRQSHNAALGLLHNPLIWPSEQFEFQTPALKDPCYLFDFHGHVPHWQKNLS